jgi:hypothetical protein
VASMDGILARLLNPTAALWCGYGTPDVNKSPHQEWDTTRITHFWTCIVPFVATTGLFLVIYHF